MKPEVCHITSAHPANDIRIYHKECISLAENGYKVHLVARGKLPPNAKNVIHHVLPTNSRLGRLGRMLFLSFRAYRIAKATKASIFHFHDPELLPYGLLLKLQGNFVIYDAHEDLPRDIMMKTWIPLSLRSGVSWLSEKIENFIARRMDMVIAATPHISHRFQLIGAKATDVRNFPNLDELTIASTKKTPNSDSPAVCYVGVISQQRGIIEMIKVVGTLGIRLILAGRFIDANTEKLARTLPEWQNVDYRGLVSRQEISGIFSESQIGLCILHPSVTHNESIPIKLFEYMAAELPVISSNFLFWREIVEQTSSGLCVDPKDISEVSKAIQWMLDNPLEAQQMGKKGRSAVEDCYNWKSEADRLFNVYKQLLNPE
jgi:glycosyltransferase involved in cell wall biosynthesis